jgi:hypothetical protein
MWRILAAVISFGFLIALLFTDLDNGQRWLLAGMIWATVAATLDRS